MSTLKEAIAKIEVERDFNNDDRSYQAALQDALDILAEVDQPEERECHLHIAHNNGSWQWSSFSAEGRRHCGDGDWYGSESEARAAAEQFCEHNNLLIRTDWADKNGKRRTLRVTDKRIEAREV